MVVTNLAGRESPARDTPEPGSPELERQLEEHRPELTAYAYRMLGSSFEAEDAVQEAWIRLGRSDTSEVENLRGWLTTVVARVCLDQLRSRRSRREDLLGERISERVASPDAGDDPERDLVLADSVGVALLVVLEALPPAERVAFVLHDLFDLPFEEIGDTYEVGVSLGVQYVMNKILIDAAFSLPALIIGGETEGATDVRTFTLGVGYAI